MSRLSSQTNVGPGAQRASTGLNSTRQAIYSAAAAGMVLVGILLWAFWTVIVDLWSEWQNDPDYSVGRLVPLVALYWVWEKRRALRTCRIRPCWWALSLLLLAQATRTFGLLFFYESVERYALVLTVAGLVMLVAGWQVFWRLRWVLAFLLLMVPLPGRVHNAVAGPLQRSAATSTAFALEVIGADVARQGNVLSLGPQTSVGVAEACSGLRMLTAFVIVASVFAFSVNRPRWQRIVLIVSSIPIAIACNVIRLVVTVLLYAATSSSVAERFFHDCAGITMMPLAVVILVGELWLMRVLVLPDAVGARPGGRAR